MRSLILPSPARGWLWSALGALVMVFGVATPSHAELANSMFPGNLGIVVVRVPPVPEIALPLDAPVVPTLALRDGSGQLTKVSFAASIFRTTGLTFTVNGTAPTVGGLQLTGGNDAGNFTRVGGKFRGSMPLNGFERVCLFGTCATAPLNVTVPLSVVGRAGGIAYAGTGNATVPNKPILVTVKGAPWTQGAVTIPTQMSTAMQPGTIMATGNFANATQTTMGATYKNVVELVTPIFISTSLSPAQVVPAYATLKFTLKSPEPGTVAALGAAIISLVAMGVARRR